MNAKRLGYVCLTLAGMALGGVVGRYTALDPDYRVKRDDGMVWLQGKDPNQAYALTTIDGETYLGDSDHNLKGVKALATYEGKEGMKPLVLSLYDRNSDLEKRIRHRQYTDAIENVRDRITDGWRNFKHNLLE